MKKFLVLCMAVLSLNACSKEEDAENTKIQSKEIQMFSIPSQGILNQKQSFDKDNTSFETRADTPILEAVNEAVRCTINPFYVSCNKTKLPKFIFMQDESLQRPTHIDYEVTKIQPLNGGILHIHTQSNCNNNWFGLCQGKIIYVLQNENNSWYVSDIFAMETNS